MISGICGRLESSIMTGFRFDTYRLLKRQVFNRIVDWINTGNMDDINYNAVVVALDNIDNIITRDHEIYSREDDYVSLEVLSWKSDELKDIFLLAIDSDTDDSDVYIDLLQIWRLLFREVFIENYGYFMNMLNDRMVENGNI